MEEVARGVRAMVEEIGLDFTVTVRPLPEPLARAYADSLVTPRSRKSGQPERYISFTRLEKQVIAMHARDPHADVLVTEEPMRECWWAHGMASFNSGFAICLSQHASFHLGKHETGHLLGYLFHDNLPLFILGYPWEGMPMPLYGLDGKPITGPFGERNSLMMLYSDSNDLSPRARDALHFFWRGLEDREKMRFLR